VNSRLRAKDLKKQYNIELKPLGEGSFGKVFKASNKSDSSMKVAVKVINKHGLDEDDLLSISREVAIM
jgi:serine/threonine protein kinase